MQNNDKFLLIALKDGGGGRENEHTNRHVIHNDGHFYPYGLIVSLQQL